MSNKELERFAVLKNVQEKKLSQTKAAEILKLSDRQIRNLLVLLKRDGPNGLVSRKRGRPSNRSKPPDFKNQVLSIVREKYDDFGPQLAKEKLEKRHNVKISTETLRKWMSDTHLWTPKQRRVKTHPSRARRQCFGELIQIDGSHEFWFEERGEKCALIVFVDDATSKITSLYFSPGESLEAYFKSLEKHLNRYGRPLNVYSDRFRVFDSPVEENLTQFRRALKSLGIGSILANSPQAKGRVERANRTLQDRLIKEMRLLGINTIEKANEYADRFVEEYNEHFSKEPVNSFDAHRPLETRVDLSRVLSRYEERTLTKDAVFQFHNKFYKIMEASKGSSLRGKKVEVRVGKGGVVRAFHGDQELTLTSLDSIREQRQAPEIRWKSRVYKAPSAAHPWRHPIYLHETVKQLKKIV